jgi:hypothetical protein
MEQLCRNAQIHKKKSEANLSPSCFRRRLMHKSFSSANESCIKPRERIIASFDIEALAFSDNGQYP